MTTTDPATQSLTRGDHGHTVTSDIRDICISDKHASGLIVPQSPKTIDAQTTSMDLSGGSPNPVERNPALPSNTRQLRSRTNAASNQVAPEPPTVTDTPCEPTASTGNGEPVSASSANEGNPDLRSSKTQASAQGQQSQSPETIGVRKPVSSAEKRAKKLARKIATTLATRRWGKGVIRQINADIRTFLRIHELSSTPSVRITTDLARDIRCDTLSPERPTTKKLGILWDEVTIRAKMSGITDAMERIYDGWYGWKVKLHIEYHPFFRFQS
jgi:hypothetical protein